MPVDPTAATELRIKINESKDTGFNVEHEARIAGTDTIITMRPSHVVGQLLCAAVFIMIDSYDSIKSDLVGKVASSKTP